MFSHINMVLLSSQPRTLLAVIAVFFVSRCFQVVIDMVFRIIFLFLLTAALVLDSLWGLFAILTLPHFECCRFSFALILCFLLFTLATESVEIESIVVECVVFISAPVCSLFPETVACHHECKEK